MTRNLEASSDLPAFESSLRTIKHFGALDKISKSKLKEKSLRKVSNINDLKNIMYGKTQLFDVRSSNVWIVQNNTYQFLRTFFERNNINPEHHSSYGYIYKPSHGQLLNQILFDQESVAVIKNTIYIKLKDCNYVLSGNIDQYLAKGIAGLSELSTSSIPTGAVYVVGEAEEKAKNGSYNFSLENGESLRISSTNSDYIPNTMSARGYDLLPNRKDIPTDVIATLKEEKLEFWTISNNSDHENSVSAKPFEFFGLKEVDYSRHGQLVEGILDRNRNFIIGIFNNGNSKSLKILRINEEATLMDEYDNIKSLEGLEHADIAGYDVKGNLRLIDGNFENYDLYTREEIFTSKVSKFEGSTIDGGCTEIFQIFKSDDFKRGLLLILGEANTLLNKAQITDLLSRIHNGDLVLRSEINNLSLICDPSKKYNESLIIIANRVIKTLDGGRNDPLRGLLNDPIKILNEYSDYLETYTNIVDLNSIKAYGHDLRLVKKGDQTGLYIVGNETHEVMIALGDHDISISEDEHGFGIVVQDKGEIQNITYRDGEGITEKLYSNDSYSGTPQLVDGIGIASLTDYGYKFVYKKLEKLEEFAIEKFDSYEEIGSFRLLKRTGEDGANPYTLVSLNNDGSFTESTAFGNHTLDELIQLSDSKAGIAMIDDSTMMIITLDEDSKSFNTIDVNIEGNTRSGIAPSYIEHGGFVLKTNAGDDENPEDFTKSPVSLKDDGAITRGPALHNLVFNDYNVGVVGEDKDGNIEIHKLGDDGYEPVYSGEYITVVNTLHGTFRKDIAFIDDAKQGQRIISRNGEGIMDEDPSAFAEFESVTGEEIKKFKTNSLLRGEGGSEVYLRFYLGDDGAMNIECTPYDDVGSFYEYNDVSYAYFRQDNKYGLLQSSEGKIIVFKEHTEDDSPLFGPGGFAFGSTDYVTDEEGNIKELVHDYDSLTLIEGTEMYHFKKDEKYGLARNNGGTMVSLNLDVELSEQMPKIYDTYMVVILAGGAANIYDLESLSEEGTMKTLGNQFRYTIEPKHLKNEFFTLKHDGGFFILGPHNEYKPQTKYIGGVSKFKNGNRQEGYIPLETDAGTTDWIMHNLDTANVTPQNPLLFHSDHKTNLTRIRDFRKMKKGVVILGDTGNKNGLFLLYKNQLILVHKGDRVGYERNMLPSKGGNHLLYQTTNGSEHYKIVRLVEAEDGYFSAHITKAAHARSKFDFSKYNEDLRVHTKGFFGSGIDREDILLSHKFMDDEIIE